MPTFIERTTARLTNKVSKTETCWLWTGYKMPNGYGAISIDGHTYTAHRLMYLVAFGDVPTTLQVCHRCDIRHCINPDHLFLGTAQDNTNDMVAKNRHTPRLGAMVPCNHCNIPIYRKKSKLQHRTKAFCNQSCHSNFMKAHPDWKPIVNKVRAS